GTHLSELHTGYRAYSREFLMTVPFLRNSLDFVFDSEMVMQAVHFELRVVEVPARTRYHADASSASVRQSVIYGFKTLGAAARFVLHRRGLLPSRKLMP
ncbi:MAG TPA: glycosyltransferase family 2 protein, partial [Solirubrobacteraceae bacterium]|nr:glycosyltransferase family 2 protein [Solirubrobacteraceae bacterium]